MSGSSTTAFDDLAADYDAAFTSTALGRQLRMLVFERYAASFAGREYLLEAGCGTGEDALHLARLGHRVLATDASPRMVRIATLKAERAGLAQRCRFLCVPMENMAAELAGERFDGTYSNFGAVNCVPALDAAAAGIAKLLAPGAPLVWVPMGRHVPWEWAWFLARGQAGKAFRRLNAAGARWRGLSIHYPSRARLRAMLAPHFEVQRMSALGCALPPSYAGHWLERAPRSLAALTRLERLAQRAGLFSGLADHYIVEAVRA